MDKRAGALMDEFRDLVYPENYSPGAKRKVSRSLPPRSASRLHSKTKCSTDFNNVLLQTANAGSGGKKPKIEAQDINIEEEARAGRVS